VGGGCVAAEYGHFFSAMGSKVTIIGRNARFLPREEPEVSELAERELGRYVKIITNHEVRKVQQTSTGSKKLTAFNNDSGERSEFFADEILMATGRSPNSTFIHPTRGGIRLDDEGWVVVNDFLETSIPNIWSFGDANGKKLFKHAADYEAYVVYRNAIKKESVKTDYTAIPHAVFTNPEIAGVGMGENEAINKYGEDNVLIGYSKYKDTVKGGVMRPHDFFVKVIQQKKTGKILGAHIIGPQASILLQEIVTAMYAPQGTSDPIIHGIHIHPALSEVVPRAFSNLMPPERYHLS
jgi:dihydrolipoamide dehydrogenase